MTRTALPPFDWHYARCVCGQTVYARAGDLRAEVVGAQGECCPLTEANFGSRLDDSLAHPAEHAIEGAVRCNACGYEKEFGAPPANGAEGDDMASKKKTTNGAPLGAANGNGKPPKGDKIGTLGEVAKVTRSEAVERKRYRMQLPCKIDENTSHAKGLELARVCRERKEFEELRAQENRDAREKAAYFDETIERLRIEVEGCVETRTVECVDRLLPTNEVEVVRLDTGEVLETRAAKPHELQESLLSLPATKGDGKGKGRKDRSTDPAPPPAIEPPFGADPAVSP